MKKRLASDLLLNYISVAVMAVGGLLFGVLIAKFYDAGALGIFSQAYAWYLFISQLAVAGIHMSILRFVPVIADDKSQLKNEFSAGIIATVMTSGAVVFFLCLALLVLNKIGVALATSMWPLLAALPIFSINKVILNCLNALSKMKLYALFQGCRNVLIALGIVVLAMLKVKPEELTWCFFIAEAILLIPGTIVILREQWLGRQSIRDRWDVILRHLRFGIRVIPGNLVMEFNSKIDVICIGLITGSNVMTGYYSFASMFFEGFYMIFVVLRRIISPKIAQYQEENRLEAEYIKLNKKVSPWLMICSFLAAGFLVLLYYLFCVVLNDREYLIALGPLVIVVAAIAFNGKSIIVGNILAQTGHPSQESIVNIVAAASNFLLNLVFIYFAGLYGAAIATAISYFVYRYLQGYYVKRMIGFRL